MAAVLVSLLLLAVTGVCPRTLVVVNSAVEVSRGRSVFITRAELQISVDPSADCKVEVVMNEPMTQRVGRLSPQVRVEQVVPYGSRSEELQVLCSVRSAGV